MDKPEILAPGGSPESIYSTVNAGCDAVYAGGKRFGARAFADNQDNDSLMRIMDDIHMAGKKLYLTVNTILTQTEIGQLYDYLAPLYENGLDAVIVQDMGVLKHIHDNFPDLSIHASTQMSITRASAANLLKEYGVTRIVPARELSFAELKAMRSGTELEMEVFVHGALCSSYSGQCLMSSLIGGRSGNRGACAQPCRKQYRLNDSDYSYMLSLKDLCTLRYIPELIDCGIDSFKIEGRMKKPEYTALVSHMYRKYVDMYYDIGREAYRHITDTSSEYKKDLKALKDVYNRGGFTSAYLVGNMSKETMLSGKRPNHEGTCVGAVDSMISGNRIAIRYSDEINRGDILEVRDENGVKVYDYTIGDTTQIQEKHIINSGYNYRNIRKGMCVFRIRNNSLIDRTLSDYPVIMNGINISGRFTAHIGKQTSLTIGFDRMDDTYTVYGDEVQTADRHSADEQYVRSKIMVSGDSCFRWSGLDIDIDDNIFLSPSGLKDIRRRAFDEYRKYYLEKYHRRRNGECNTHNIMGYNHNIIIPKHKKNRLIIECYSLDILRCVMDIMSDNCIAEDAKWTDDTEYTLYIHIRPSELYDMSELYSVMDNAGLSFCIVLPRIIRNDELYDRYAAITEEITSRYNDEDGGSRFKGIVVCAPEQLAVYSNICNRLNLDIITYDNMYVRNTYAVDFYADNGVTEVMMPVEAADREIADMNSMIGNRVGLRMSVLIYGKPAAMITAWTPGAEGILTDTYNNSYRVINMQEYNEILNYEPVDRIVNSGLYDNVAKRVVFTDEEYDDIIRVLDRVSKEL